MHKLPSSQQELSVSLPLKSFNLMEMYLLHLILFHKKTGVSLVIHRYYFTRGLPQNQYFLLKIKPHIFTNIENKERKNLKVDYKQKPVYPVGNITTQ